MAHRCFSNTTVQISPCILAQARFNLGFSTLKSTSKKLVQSNIEIESEAY